MGSTLCWLLANKALPGGTHRVSFVHDWLGGALRGGLPVTDPADAGSAGLFDLSRMRWHEEIIRALKLADGLLPPVRESGEVVGPVAAAAAKESGLPAGMPVCNATGDNQASVVGSIADMDKSVLVNIGTGGQISWAVPSFRRAAGMETRYLPGRRFMLVGASLCGGRAYAWINDVVRDWLRAMGREIDREAAYAKLNEMAASAPAGAGGVTARTTLVGTRRDPAVRGAFEGVSLGNFSLPNVARAVLEGVVEELCAFYDLAGGDMRSAHGAAIASGNAVRKNPLLCEILASRLGKPVKVPKHREEAAFGAALVAGVGAGVWRDMDEAGRCVRYA
jgi:sugar (pentulose or hexulose) kinase